MGTLYLVRHGQASFGADDYDHLSELGQRQSVRLGEYFAGRGIHFDGLIAGTLRRHKQTLAGILQGMNRAGEHLAWDGLNEYDSEALLATVHPGQLPKPDTPERYRHHFRMLRDAMARWMAGDTSPAGMPSYAQFVAGVASALTLLSSLSADGLTQPFGLRPAPGRRPRRPVPCRTPAARRRSR